MAKLPHLQDTLNREGARFSLVTIPSCLVVAVGGVQGVGVIGAVVIGCVKRQLTGTEM